ncbi:MAG TPA: heavy metal sensor histidine kinase [Bryobacteraceae bacterium]|nr:heavy metal sensor histidine kinase [Bryobacteraceae bacterium]
MIKSLRFRITAWYVAFFSLLFLAFGAFLYEFLSRALLNRVDNTLASQARTAAAMFGDEMDEEQGDIFKAAQGVTVNLKMDNRVAILSGWQILSSTGPVFQRELEAIRARSAAPEGQVLALPKLGKHGERAALLDATARGQTVLVLALADLDPVAASLAEVRQLLWLAMPLLVALAALGGYWLASRGLAPVGWMAEQARRITGSNLDTRLDIGHASHELETLAASFNELLGRLDQSFQGMRRFVADASHELRTPIAIIRGEADVALSRERAPAEYRASLAIVLDETRRLSRLVDDLLNLARADAGHVRLRMEDFYFNDLMAECCRSVQPLAHARSIHLECQAAGDVAFRGDQDLLRRLVVNLLDNAIRYTPRGGKVSAALEGEGPQLRIAISDTGCGIAAEAAPHVFERFYRADKGRSREDGGFGLGLAIVKWIAESHRGSVDLLSQPGAGSTFTVRLPR